MTSQQATKIARYLNLTYKATFNYACARYSKELKTYVVLVFAYDNTTFEIKYIDEWSTLTRDHFRHMVNDMRGAY